MFDIDRIVFQNIALEKSAASPDLDDLLNAQGKEVLQIQCPDEFRDLQEEDVRMS